MYYHITYLLFFIFWEVYLNIIGTFLIQSIIYIVYFLVFRRFLHNWHYEQCRGGGRRRPAGGPGPGPIILHMFLSFPNTLRPTPSYSAAQNLSDLLYIRVVGPFFWGRPKNFFSLVPKAIVSGPHYGYCANILSTKNYYYCTISNFGNIVFGISNIVVVPVLATVVESAKLSTWQYDLWCVLVSSRLHRMLLDFGK